MAPTAPVTEPTRVPEAVSPVLVGSLPVTVPGARSGAVLGQVEGFFVDGDVGVAGRIQLAVGDIDGDGRGAFIAIGIAHGVGEHIHRAGAVHGIGVAVIDGVAVGVQRQVP
jgi:hypothetical protein